MRANDTSSVQMRGTPAKRPMMRTATAANAATVPGLFFRNVIRDEPPCLLLAGAFVAPQLVDVVATGTDQPAGELALGRDCPLDAVHVRLLDDAPQRPGAPPVVDLLAEDAV